MQKDVSPATKPIKIAVIIPVYNCEKFLRRAVTSVLVQPYQNIAIVLVDDGSTDGSSHLCDELATENERITALHQNNAGVSVARNTGIEFVLKNLDCQYLAFLDADDAWSDNFFTDECISALPDATIIRFQSVNCDSSLSRHMHPVAVEEGVYEGDASNVHRCLSSHFAAALYKDTLFIDHQIRFIAGLRHSEDVLFLRTCAYHADSVAFFNRILYLYRNNPMSCVHTNTATGFAYFDPIFHAYMAHDFDGAGFVSWYFVDAVQDHLKYGKPVSEAKKWILQHPEYVAIARECGGDRAKEVLTALETHPYLYAGKWRIKGLAFIFARKLVHTKPFSMLYDAHRYRNVLPSNQQAPSPEVSL